MVKPTKPTKPTKPSKPSKPSKPQGEPSPANGDKPPKLVRDSFTMPAADFALVAVLKARALQAQRPVKKSELLRAGLHALEGLSPKALTHALDALAPIKAGRPKKK